MDLDSLPDDALVQVLSHLPPRQLLTTARAVSRRWRDLAAHRDAWTRCHLQVCFPADYPVAAEVLRRAPCLRGLALHFVALPGPLADLASSTVCSVRQLKLVTWGKESLQAATRIVRNQMDKGRLRALSLYLNDFNARWLQEFLDVITGLDLTSLRIVYVQGTLPSGVLGAPSRRFGGSAAGRLRHLKLRAVSEEFACDFIDPNASSLQLVDLACSVGRKLSTCLLRCESLTSLTVHAWWTLDPASSTADLCRYLQSAYRLQSLRIKYEMEDKLFDGSSGEDPRLLELLSSLASSGKSVLDTLGLSYATIESRTYAKQLADALAGLPRLRVLRLNLTRVDVLVEDLLAHDLPSLQVIQCVAPFSCCDASENDCRVPTFRRLVRGNTRLHVVGVVLEHFTSDCVSVHEPRRECACCREHPVNRREDSLQTFGLYGHSPMDRCSVCRRFSATQLWVKV